MATISIHYQRSWWLGADANVYIDGQRTGTVRNGKTESYDIAPGTHQLQFKSTRWLLQHQKFDRFNIWDSPSATFSVTENTGKMFKVKNTRFSFLYSVIFTIIGLLTIFLATQNNYLTSHLSSFQLVFLVGGFIVLLLILSSILFKEKFLSTEETEHLR
jgi:hypothetical protein